MEIRLIRRPHPNRMVRGSGIAPTDPYLDWCWLPVVGPSTVALVRHVAELTATTRDARIPVTNLSGLLGLGRVVDPSARNNKLVRTIIRAEQFGLGFTSLAVPEGATFGIHDHVALVPARLLERLPEAAWQRHVAAVETANEALQAAGLPALQSPLPTASRTSAGPAAAVPTATPGPVGARPHQALHAVPPIARLDVQASVSTPPPELSL
jgi:hypothetical protein